LNFLSAATGCELGEITALTARLQALRQQLTDSPTPAA
jgi:hypothetical protein